MKNGIDVIKDLENKMNKELLKQPPNDRVTHAEFLYEIGLINEYEMGDMIEKELLQGGRWQWGGSKKEFHFDRIHFGYTVKEIAILNKKGLYGGWCIGQATPLKIDFSDSIEQATPYARLIKIDFSDSEILKGD